MPKIHGGQFIPLLPDPDTQVRVKNS